MLWRILTVDVLCLSGRYREATAKYDPTGMTVSCSNKCGIPGKVVSANLAI